ncbi:hypothetical protein ACFVZW_33440 [Streptomyces sp. NPDC059567]|uniref:hypothetical protein n=1 Tax=Streptomyces sp. NPDC059567 TaxID=3346867 RepID=UPI0036C9C3CD
MARRVLAEDQRKPDDVDLFSALTYPAASPIEPASGPKLSEEQVRRQLIRFLHRPTGRHTAQVKRSLALFDSTAVQAKIADPSLRAAFAAMVGTLWEPTISHFLNSGRFTTAAFGTTSHPTAIPLALSVDNGDGTRRVVFNERYNREHFALFIGTMGHEVMHDDDQNSLSEEAILGGLTSMVDAQVYSRHPDLAYGGTELARRDNSAVLAWLNSKSRDSPDSQLIAPTGVGLFPGNNLPPLPDFWSLFGNPADSSPAPTLVFTQVLARLGLPGSAVFDKSTAETFGQANDTWLSYPDRVGLNVLLQTVTVKEIADEHHLSKDRVIKILSLRDELAAIAARQSAAP